jgi:hypothetical protein
VSILDSLKRFFGGSAPEHADEPVPAHRAHGHEHGQEHDHEHEHEHEEGHEQ